MPSLPVLVVISHAPAPPPPPVSTTLRVGVFEDGQVQSSDAIWQATINDLKAHNCNAVLLTVTTPNLAVSDAAQNFSVVAAPHPQLYAAYPSPSTVLSDGAAHTVIDPITTLMASATSLIGYNIRDDATVSRNAQFVQEKAIFAANDPSHPTSPLLVMTGASAWEVYDILNPRAWMGYNFPFKQDTAAFQVFRNHKDWYKYLREQFQLKPQADPLWLVLQGHETINTIDPNPAGDLRQPSAAEISLQMWEAFGEEANGLFVYIYSNAVNGGIGLNWTGIKNLPTQYAMVATVAAKLLALDTFRAKGQKIPDRFKVTAGHYISTFKNQTQDIYYVVAANQSAATANLTITSDYFSGTLHDLDSGVDTAIGAAISFTSGEGKMFRITAPTVLTPPANQTNKVTNGDFESGTTGWSGDGTFALDTGVKHSGTQSLKLGPGGSIVSRNVTLVANTDYYFSYWIKTQNLSNNAVGMRVLQTAPTISPNELTNINWHQTGSRDWVKRIGFFRTTTDMTQCRVDIVYSLSSGQVIWIDDISLYAEGTPAADEYLIERITDVTPSLPTFAPESYGTVTGTNAAVDQPLVQAAIDAASVAGGTVLLTGTYAYGARAGTRTIGANRNIAYSLKINPGVNNVTISGGGTLKLTQVPSVSGVNSYVGLMIGQGWDTDANGPWQSTGWMESIITYCNNIVVTTVAFDNSLLTDGQLQTLSGGVIGSVMTLAACLNSTVSNVTINRAWGVTGGISCSTWTRYLSVKNCTITTAYNVGFWFDGAWDSTFDTLTCLDFVGAATPVGGVSAANTDNRRVSERCTWKNCSFADVHDGIVINGSFCIIDNGSVILLGDNLTHRCYVFATPASSVRGNWEAQGNILRNSSGNRPAGSTNAKGYFLYLNGNPSAYGGGILRVFNSQVYSNTIGSSTRKLGYAVVYGPEAKDNTFGASLGANSYYCTLKADVSGGTATGNIDTGNTPL